MITDNQDLVGARAVDYADHIPYWRDKAVHEMVHVENCAGSGATAICDIETADPARAIGLFCRQAMAFQCLEDRDCIRHANGD